jgi:hypothetical protein
MRSCTSSLLLPRSANQVTANRHDGVTSYVKQFAARLDCPPSRLKFLHRNTDYPH